MSSNMSPTPWITEDPFAAEDRSETSPAQRAQTLCELGRFVAAETKQQAQLVKASGPKMD